MANYDKKVIDSNPFPSKMDVANKDKLYYSIGAGENLLEVENLDFTGLKSAVYSKFCT